MKNTDFKIGDEVQVIIGFFNGFKGTIIDFNGLLIRVDLHTNCYGEDCCLVDGYLKDELKLLNETFTNNSLAMKVLLMSSIK